MKTKLTIEFENPGSLPFQLRIYDNSGKQINKTDELRNDNIELDVENFPEGVYYFKLINYKVRRSSIGKFMVVKE